jgi:hypothetical protein
VFDGGGTAYPFNEIKNTSREALVERFQSSSKHI